MHMQILQLLTHAQGTDSHRQSRKSLGTHKVTQVRLRFAVASWCLARLFGLGWLFASQLLSSLH